MFFVRFLFLFQKSEFRRSSWTCRGAARASAGAASDAEIPSGNKSGRIAFQHFTAMIFSAAALMAASQLLLAARVAAVAAGPVGLPLNVSGFLDVTGPPYYADNSGRSDCTAALQKAVDDARSQFQAVYLPHGTYLISDTITLLQVDAWDPGESNPMNNTWPCRSV